MKDKSDGELLREQRIKMLCDDFELSDREYLCRYATDEDWHNLAVKIERRLAEEKKAFEKSTISTRITVSASLGVRKMGQNETVSETEPEKIK